MQNDQHQHASRHRIEDEEGKPWGMDLNTFCMLMHLSQFAGWVFPMAGLILPIVMWATNKEENIEVHLHGLIIFNWMLSQLIYVFASVILIFMLVGIPLLIILAICGIIFTILGAVKANEGKYWPYPLSIDFFGVKRRLEGL